MFWKDFVCVHYHLGKMYHRKSLICGGPLFKFTMFDLSLSLPPLGWTGV